MSAVATEDPIGQSAGASPAGPPGHSAGASPAPLRIGPLTLDVPVVLAPMAGVTNRAFRRLCRRFGAGLYVSEMITARALVEGNARTLDMVRFDPDEQPRSVQLYGVDPRVMAEAVRILVGDHGVEHVDLNVGCPATKVTRKGGGSALPVRRALFGAIVEASVRAAGPVPFTVKMRKGVDDDHLTYLEAGRIAEDAGAAAVALHARTAEQLYSGAADWGAIARLKEAVTTVPVLGNGDILEGADAVRMMVETGCDGVVVGRGCLSAEDRDAVLGRVTATDQIGDLADCDLVIESVVEDLDVKKALFAELDATVKADGILATNTSTLPVVEMAVATGRPDQVVGVHFFNPAPMMSLVEVIAPLTASDATVEAVTAFASACGKDPVQVKDRAGFIVNALLFPYLNNAVRMLENGTASRDDIDSAMKGGCNFPMGPLALLDLVGLDTSLSILEALYAEFADPNYSPAPALRRMVAAGHLGRKSGRGFYDY